MLGRGMNDTGVVLGAMMGLEISSWRSAEVGAGMGNSGASIRWRAGISISAKGLPAIAGDISTGVRLGEAGRGNSKGPVGVGVGRDTSCALAKVRADIWFESKGSSAIAGDMSTDMTLENAYKRSADIFSWVCDKSRQRARDPLRSLNSDKDRIAEPFMVVGEITAVELDASFDGRIRLTVMPNGHPKL